MKLLSLVGHTEGSLHYTKYTLVALLAIEEAFDTVRPQLIIQTIDQLDIH